MRVEILGLFVIGLAGCAAAAPASRGFLMKFQPGVHVGMHSHSHDYYAVVLSGRPHHWRRGADRQTSRWRQNQVTESRDPRNQKS